MNDHRKSINLGTSWSLCVSPEQWQIMWLRASSQAASVRQSALDGWREQGKDRESIWGYLSSRALQASFQQSLAWPFLQERWCLWWITGGGGFFHRFVCLLFASIWPLPCDSEFQTLTAICGEKNMYLHFF